MLTRLPADVMSEFLFLTGSLTHGPTTAPGGGRKPRAQRWPQASGFSLVFPTLKCFKFRP
jgi:hypothetical protein